jgi:tripartite-type tricarboxylate transporter receptor subunit TctC
MAPALPHIRSGKLVALAVTGAKRSPLLPDVPTVAEVALPGFETAQWQGIAAPAGRPAPVVARVHDELQSLQLWLSSSSANPGLSAP